MKELNVFDLSDLDLVNIGLKDMTDKKVRLCTRLNEETFNKRLELNTKNVDIENIEIIESCGVLFHGSQVLVDDLKSGYELYNEGIAVNCQNVGGYCRGVSFTDDLDVAKRFAMDARCNDTGWIYIYEFQGSMCYVDVDDAAWLYNIVDKLLEKGVDLVVINNNREREAVCINKNAINLHMILPSSTPTDYIWHILNSCDLYTPAEMDELLDAAIEHSDE